MKLNDTAYAYLFIIFLILVTIFITLIFLNLIEPLKIGSFSLYFTEQALPNRLNRLYCLAFFPDRISFINLFVIAIHIAIKGMLRSFLPVNTLCYYHGIYVNLAA